MYYDLIHSMNKQTKTGKTDIQRAATKVTDRDYFSSSIRLFSQHLFV